MQGGGTVGDEAGLAGAADGTLPVVGNLLEGGAGGNAGIGIPFGRVVDHGADAADPEAGDGVGGLGGIAFALQSSQGHPVAFGVMMFNGGEEAEVAGGLFEDAGVLPGFGNLLVEFRSGGGVTIRAGRVGKFRVHGGVLVGFPLNGQLQATAEERLPLFGGQGLGIFNHQFRVEETEMGKGVLGFLGGGVPEELGQVFVAQGFGHFGEEEVFAVGHAFTAKGGFKIGMGAGSGKIHGGAEASTLLFI